MARQIRPGQLQENVLYNISASFAVSASHEITHEVSSSYAESASFAVTASHALNTTPLPIGTVSGSAQITALGFVTSSATSSFVVNSQTSSFVTNSATASFVTNSATASFVNNSATSSFVLNSQTSSMSVLSASFATTASHLLNNPPPFPFTGDAVITGSLVVSGSGNQGGLRTNTRNIILGQGAGNNQDAINGPYNVMIGYQAGYTNTAGDSNVCIGQNAGYALSTNASDDNIFIGKLAGAGGTSPAARMSDANYNIGLGYETMLFLTSGDSNIGFGFRTLRNISSGKYNVGFGESALYNTDTGQNNIGIGYYAGLNQTSGNSNITIGSGSLGIAGESNQLRIGNGNTITTISASLDTGDIILKNTTVTNLTASNNILINGGGLDIKNGGAQSYARFYCESGNAHYTELKAQPHSLFSGNPTMLLPAYDLDFAKPNFQANITASGDISASGNISVGGDIDTVGSVSVGFNEKFTVTTYNTILTQNALQLYGGAYISGRNAANGSFVTIDTATGGNSFGFARLGVKGTGLGASQHIFEVQNSSGDSKFIISNNGHITASANISSSGDLIGNQLVLAGGTFTSASLAAGGGGGTTVVANPGGSPGTALTTITIAGSDFSVGSGGGSAPAGTVSGSAQITALGFVTSSATASFSNVVANPGSSGGGALSTVTIDGTSFSVGGGAGGSSIFTASNGYQQTINNLIISQSNASSSLSIINSGSTVFDVQGSVGQLFEVVDGLDGVLMSVNDISGIPILTVSSSGDVFLAAGSTLQGTAATASFVPGVTAAFPFTGSAAISGSLNINGSGSGIFDIDGTVGQLFSVNDGLDGILMSVNDISGLPLFEVSSSGDVEIHQGNISGSSVSTASFGTYLGDGSQLTGISSGGGTAEMIASGSTSASADPGTGIVVNHSGSTAFSVIGDVGTLFSVDDSLTGTLFSANDISGFPVLQADSTGEVYLGKTPQSLYTTAVVSSTTAATTHSLVSLSTSSYDGAFFEYTAISSSNARAGSIMSVWNGANIVSTETTSSQIGSTTDLTAEVIISQSQAQLVVYGANASYKVKTIIKAI